MKLKEIILVIVLLFLDLISKYFVSMKVSVYNSITVINKFFYITYAKNTGAAWSILQGKQVFLSLVSFIAIVYMVYYLYKNKFMSNINRYLICIMLAGATGNFIDRVYLGYVRDFLHFYIFRYSFPIFNFADMFLCVGIFSLFLYSYIEVKNGKV